MFANILSLERCKHRGLLRLLRINRFHLLNNLWNLCSSYPHLLSRVLFAPPGHYAPHSRILISLYLLNQRSPYSPCQSRVPCAPSFFSFPQASLHCCGLQTGFFSGAVCFIRMTLARSAFSWFSDWIPKVQKRMSLARSVFHGFQIGVIGLKRCKSV